MAKGRLAESAELLEKCFNATTGKPKGRNLFHRERSTLNHSKHNNNPINLLDAVQSVETIYKNAVEKRNSSSSEDDIMELSGPVFDDMYSNFKTSEFQLGASAREVGYDTLPRAHCSYDNQPEKDQSRGRPASRSPAQPQQQSPEDHVQQTIRKS